MGMFLLICISLKQSLYNMRTVLLCKGRADFFKVFKRDFDFITNKSMAMMPIIHIPNKISPTIEGVSLLTDSAKSFICFAASDIFQLSVVFVILSMFDDAVFLNVPSHEKICQNPTGRKGINGTARSPSSRNHRLNCIRLVK